MAAERHRSSPAPRILLVGRDDADSAALGRALRDHGGLRLGVPASGGVEPALRELARGGFDALLLDLAALATEDASELLGAAMPMVVLGEEAEAGCPPGNAARPRVFLARGSDPNAVVDAVLRVIDFRGPAREAEASARTPDRVGHDPLTGLLNGEAFADRLYESIARTRRHQYGLAVLRIELDDREQGADTDEILCVAAQRLRQSLREGDPLARISHNAFSVLVHDARLDRDLGIVARRLLAHLSEPVESSGVTQALSASVGIALYPGDGLDVAALLRNAETAMYQAKARGQDRFHFYEEGVDRAVANRLRLESSLREAVQRDELMLHYQPQVDVVRSEFTGVEALLRWRSEGGLVEPASFLPAAECIGIMGKMGEWVLRNACREIAELKPAPRNNLLLGVNVSRSQLVDPGFPELVSDVLGDWGIQPRCLELEVHDELLGPDLHDLKEPLAALRRRGVRIAIDGFGTGPASLQAVRRVGIDTLKIDRSFVREVPDDAAAVGVVAAAVTLSRALGCQPVPVGVEHESQARELVRLGCTRMQGFAFAPPVDADGLVPILSGSGGSIPEID